MKKNWSKLKTLISAYEQPHGVFLSLINEEGKIMCANANMVKTLHLENPRKTATNFFDLLHPDNLSEFKTAIRESAKENSPYSIELFLKNGSYHPMKWEINCMDRSDSGSNDYLCVGHKMKNDDGIIQFNQLDRTALFRGFMKQTPNLAWVVDEDSKLVFANQSFFYYFGLNGEDSINKKVTDLVPSSVSDSLYHQHLKVLKTGRPIQFTEKVKWADGKSLAFHINIFPVDGVAGKKMLGGQAVNLSEKFAAEEKLREANERLMLLTRATSDAIWEWDMQTGNIFRNDALMDIIGYNLEEPKGLSWWFRRIHPEDRNRLSDTVKETTDNNLHSWEEDYRFKCADGNYKHMHDKGYIVYENGLPVKMIGSLQDVSELKELESQLMDERMQRQKEISETVIRVQEKERTRIGHELHDNVNQILSTVKLFIDMLTPSGKEEMDIKKKSIDYIMLAINEIRNLSKELVVPQLNQNGLVASINTLIEDIHLSTKLKIRFTHDHENDLLSSGIKVTLFRIIQEQLKNILKHSKADKIDIYLQSKSGSVHLTIKDNGIGFDPKQTQRGIGLSNIYERTRFYNGQVEIETAHGKGCSVSLSIPIL